MYWQQHFRLVLLCSPERRCSTTACLFIYMLVWQSVWSDHVSVISFFTLYGLSLGLPQNGKVYPTQHSGSKLKGQGHAHWQKSTFDTGGSICYLQKQKRSSVCLYACHQSHFLYLPAKQLTHVFLQKSLYFLIMLL